jgi:hypothetical protein
MWRRPYQERLPTVGQLANRFTCVRNERRLMHELEPEIPL